MALDARILLGSQNYIEPYGNALARAMQLKAQQQGMQMNALQMQQAQQQMAEKERQRNALQELIGSIPSPQMAASQNALAGGGGPTVQNAQRMAPVDPRLQMLHGAMKAGAVSPVDYIGAAYPQAKPADYKVVGDALVKIGPTGVEPVYKGEKPQDPNKPFLMVNGKIVPNPAYQQYAKDVAKAGASAGVTVNTGQKGLDNTLKLRGDFRSEPVYKAHQEMTAAYSQIKQSLKQQSPAGDLAGATKIMKLLDPGSVVRESELGMAMAASGLMDRVENYAKMIITGQKLTPTQRADFQKLADALYAESVGQYNAKRGEYQGIAERNQLPVADVLGPESKAQVIKPAPTVKPSVSNW